MRNVILCGDVREQLRLIDDESVNCVVTSPPYWGLRDYGVDGQLGLESTIEEYICHMVEVFGEVRRVLRKDGTLWLNMGDCYAGGRSGPEGDHVGLEGSRNNQSESRKARESFRRDRQDVGDVRHKSSPALKPKDLIGQPWRLAFALQADGWWLRADIIWSKNNPMPESVSDRPTRSHEYVFLMAKSKHYYYDAEAIRETASSNTHARRARVTADAKYAPTRGRGGINGMRAASVNPKAAPAGSGIKMNESFSAAVVDVVETRNKRSVWPISTEPNAEAHFASFPTELVKPCILAGCPEGGIVLDPFLGSGTTALVAKTAGRDYIGIELNPEYVEMAKRRINVDQERML